MISVCIIAYNEEKVIKRCLNSIKDVVDEIIVVHDGDCLDKTLEICREYGAKIFIRPHYGAMEFHAPFCFKQAKGDWILRIDADEFLSEELRKGIINLTNKKDISAYEFLWPLWDGQRKLTINWPHKLCLFQKESVSFLGIVHFLPEIKGKIKKSCLVLEHRPDYNNFTWRIFKNKWLSWAKLQALMYLKKFEEVDKFNYKGDNWPPKIKIRIRFPIILMPFEFLITFLKSLTSGGWTGYWLIKFKVAFMLGVYRTMVNYYIFIYK
jgi:glycosyltransferase involved in cell wall biosynthesis